MTKGTCQSCPNGHTPKDMRPSLRKEALIDVFPSKVIKGFVCKDCLDKEDLITEEG